MYGKQSKKHKLNIRCWLRSEWVWVWLDEDDVANMRGKENNELYLPPASIVTNMTPHDQMSAGCA